MDLSLWEESARGGVLGHEEFEFGDDECLSNKFLATFDP